MQKISAYIPCHNSAETLARTIRSLQAQSHPVDEILLIDDASTDGSASVAESLGPRVIRQAMRLGRGATRALAMTEAQHDLVLCIDAGKSLPPDFVERLLPWFADPTVAAVFGRCTRQDPRTPAERWLARHLFKQDLPISVARRTSMATGGLLARRSAILGVGNYDATKTHGEDRELGDRLLAADFDVVFEPSAVYFCHLEVTVASVLERYWRWNFAGHKRPSFGSYFKQVRYEVKMMALKDFLNGDPGVGLISLICPHYCFGRSCIKNI